MSSTRPGTVALAALAVAAASCVAPASEGVPRPTMPAALSSLPPATATTAVTTTAATTHNPLPPEVPSPPEIPAGGSVCDLYDPAVAELGVVAAADVVEASGIAAGRLDPSVYWVVNDSGNDPVLHAVGEDGSARAAIPVAGTFGFDWEDIAIGPGPTPETDYVYIGDIGDNLRLRNTITLFRFPEPDVAAPPPEITPEVIRLAYPDHAEDAEALWVDPPTGDAFVVTKRQPDGRSVVFRATLPVEATVPVPLEPIAELTFPGNGQVTAAAVSDDGAVVALRGYDEVWMWVRRELDYAETFAMAPCSAPAPVEVQGEALTFVSGGLSYVTLSEGSAKPLNLVRFRP